MQPFPPTNCSIMYLQKQELPKPPSRAPQELCKAWRCADGAGGKRLPVDPSVVYKRWVSMSLRAHTSCRVVGLHSTISDLVCPNQSPTNMGWAGRSLLTRAAGMGTGWSLLATLLCATAMAPWPRKGNLHLTSPIPACWQQVWSRGRSMQKSMRRAVRKDNR